MAGSKKIDGIVRVDDPKGYRTPSKIVAASTKSTDNGGLPRVITHEPDLSAARSLQRSLGLIGNSVEELGTSIEYHNKQVEAEEEKQKRKAEYEAEKAQAKAERESAIHRRDDAFIWAETDGKIKYKEFTDNFMKRVNSDEFSFETAEAIRDEAINELKSWTVGASKEELYATRKLFSGATNVIISESSKRVAELRSDRTKSDAIAMYDNFDSETFGELSKTIIRQNVEMGGSEEEGKALIIDASLDKMRALGTQMKLDEIEELEDSVNSAGIFEQFSDEHFAWLDRVNKIEGLAERQYLEDQQQHLEKAALMAEEYAQKFDSLDELDQEIEHMEGIKTDANNPYASKWRDIHLAALGEQKNILLGKSGEYKELIGYADELTSGYFKSAGIDLGDGSSIGGIGVAQMKTGSGQIVQAHPMLIELGRKAAIRESVTFLQKNSLDSDIQSDASREAVLNIFQKHLGKFGTVKEDGSFAGFSFSDPSYIEERPPEKWTPQYMTARKDMYYDKVKKLAETMPIIDAVNEVIPEGAPEHKHYRSLFYDKFVVDQRQKQHLEHAQSEAKRYKMEGHAIDDIRAEEMANQSLYKSWDELKERGAGDYSYLKDIPEDTDPSFISEVWEQFTTAKNWMPEGRDKYPFLLEVPFTLEEIDQTKSYLESKGQKDPYKGKDPSEIITLIKETREQAHLSLLKQQHEELNKFKVEIGKLKEAIIRGYEKPKTTMRIEGYNQ